MKYLFSCILFLITLSFSTVSAQIDESKRYDEEAIQKETRFVTASQLQILGRYEEAIDLYKKILKEDGENDVVYFQLSRCYEAESVFDESIKHAKTAYAMDENNEYYALQLAEAYEANLEYTEAANTYFSYAKTHEEEKFFYQRAIYFYLKSQNFEEAISTLDKMEKIFGIEEDVSRQKFEIYSKQGQSKKAIKQIQNLIKAYPKKEKYKLTLANYYLTLGNMAKAKDIFKGILKRNPNNETAMRFMELSNAPASNDEVNYLRAVSADIPNKSITLDQKIGKILPVLKSLHDRPNTELNQELIKITKELCEVYPNDAKPKALLGDALMQAENYSEAIEAYQSTLKLNGAVFDVWHQLMMAQKKTEAFQDLLKTSDKALMRFPNQGLSYLFYGHALNLTEDPTEGLSILQEGLAIARSDVNLKNNFTVEMARSKYLLAKYEDAESMLEEKILVTSEALELYGDVLFQQDKVNLAVETWKKALKIDSDNLRLANKISQKQL